MTCPNLIHETEFTLFGARTNVILHLPLSYHGHDIPVHPLLPALPRRDRSPEGSGESTRSRQTRCPQSGPFPLQR